MKRTALLLALAALLLAANVAVAKPQAAESTGYKLDWFTLMTSSGGDRMASTQYTLRVTLGQTAIGGMDSASYGACLGYWCGISPVRTVYLPLVVR